MDEDGLPTLFLDTRPDFRFQFHLRLFERERKKKLWNWKTSSGIKLREISTSSPPPYRIYRNYYPRYDGRIKLLESGLFSIFFYYFVRLIKRIRFR